MKNANCQRQSFWLSVSVWLTDKLHQYGIYILLYSIISSFTFIREGFQEEHSVSILGKLYQKNSSEGLKSISPKTAVSKGGLSLNWLQDVWHHLPSFRGPDLWPYVACNAAGLGSAVYCLIYWIRVWFTASDRSIQNNKSVHFHVTISIFHFFLPCVTYDTSKCNFSNITGMCPLT